MKVEIVSITEFTHSIEVYPGDEVHVTHKFWENGVPKENKCSVQVIEEHCTWTHSILFRLNGHLNHIIGDQDTIEWLEDQA